MTSGNAFRDGAHALVAATTGSTNGDTEHPPKRRKLSSPPAQASIFTKTGDASAALEVDHMILDYLSHGATNAVLASRMSRNTKPPGLGHKLAMVDAFLEMFKARHPSYAPDPELRFRLLLTKFATLYCYRLGRTTAVPSQHALRNMRDANTARAMQWIQHADRMPSSKCDVSAFDPGLASDHINTEANVGLPRIDATPKSTTEAQRITATKAHQQAYLEARRAYTLKVLKYPAEGDAYEDAFYGTPECPSLLDLLPTYMAVIAARNELNNSNLSTGLMELAAQFMLQACLEQYLVCGATGSDAIDEAFAWGHKPPQSTNGHNPDSASTSSVNSAGPPNETDRMFQDEDDHSQEIADWNEIKASHIAELAHSDAGTLRQHLEEVADGYPIDVFEETILQLLAGLAASLPTPVLSQLEAGTLEGMSSAETQSFLQEYGLDGRWPTMSSN
jgi:hypothetical protein